MKDGKFETQKEIFEALLRGEKLTYYNWDNDQFIKIDSCAHLVNEDNEGIFPNFFPTSDWSIYQEPKKKKTIEVKFYQYHYINYGVFLISGWTTEIWDTYSYSTITHEKIRTLLKMEERIETYEVDDDQK